MYDYILRIQYPGEDEPKWALAFSRRGDYQIINLETKPINGKIKRGHAELVILEENKFVDQTIPIKKAGRDHLQTAIARALNGSGRPK